MPVPHVITYVPGPVTAVVAEGVALLVEADPTGPVTLACRAAARENAVDGLLGTLSGGASPPPSFALAATEGDGLRLVVGGRGQVEFAAGVAATLSAAGSSGWLERRLDDAPDLRLSILDPARPIDPSWAALPIEAGTVLAIALIVAGAPARHAVDPDATTGQFATEPPPPPPAAPPPPSREPQPPQPPQAATVVAPAFAASPSPQSSGGGPMVQAVRCAIGHLNAPFVVGACRVCGAPVPAQDPFPAARPVLGVLALPSGESVPVDRDMLLGRAPFSVDADAPSGPRLVTLASPNNDLSRTHVRVGIDGWLVQVTDLGSTNGTVVTMPGQPGIRLRAHEPFALVPGTVLNLADEALVRFEVPQ